MKRKDAVLALADFMNQQASRGYASIEGRADDLLNFMEKLGMAPPCLDSDRSQAVMRVYYSASLNRWDEDFEKDPKLMESLEKRKAWELERSTPEGRAAIRARIDAGIKRRSGKS